MIQINRAAQQSSSASEELSATAEEMKGYALKLQLMMNYFNLCGMVGASPKSYALRG